MTGQPHPAWGWQRKVGRAAMLVLWDLWAHASLAEEHPEVWPSQYTLAASQGVSTRAVRRSIAELRKAGAITASRSHSGRNVYRLNRCNSSVASEIARAADELKIAELAPPPDTRDPVSQDTSRPPDTRVPPDTSRPVAPDTSRPVLQDTRDPEQLTTSEPPTNHQPRERPSEQFALIPPEAKADPVRDLWDLQERYRREVSPKARGLELTAERRRRVAARLKTHGMDACRHVLEVRRAECMANPESVRWLNGVTNWRPDPFDLALSMSVESAAQPKVRKLHHQHYEDRPWKTSTKKASETD